MTTTGEVDVVIVGAGAAGGVIARELSRHPLRVVCLEQGDWVHPMEHPHAHQAWELEKLRNWAFDPNMRDLPEDYPVTGDTMPMMINAVGGSTVHYLAFWPRLRPVDFRKGTEHGLGASADWPLTYEDLAPYYERSDADFGVSGFVGDPANPPRSARQGPAVAPGRSGLAGIRAIDKLGWHWFPGENAILTGRGRPGRLPCNACGNCASGCPRGSIGSTDVTHWPDALRGGVDLRTHARVTRVTTGADGRADGVDYVDRRTGEGHRVTAKVVVLAGNGVGTPRLLLMSGLANSSDQVGRNLMHHSYGFLDAFVDEPVHGHQGAFGGNAYSQEFYETDVSRGFVNGFSLFAGNARSYGAATQASGFATGYTTPWGAGHRAFFDDHFGHHIVIGVQGEDLPLPDNRVTLDPVVVDSSGLPAPHIDYRLVEHDRRIIEFGLDRAAEVASALGATETNSSGVAWPPPAWHLLGTCRMGDDPATSVTNRWHQSWDVPNLLVCDGSSFVTCGGVNPTSTIAALALRCAEHLAEHGTAIAAGELT